MGHVLEMKSGEATATFVFVTFTAPVSGVIVGGIITTYLGGYNSRKSHILQCVIGVFALIFSLPTPFFGPEHATSWIIFIWFVLFFGGFTLP